MYRVPEYVWIEGFKTFHFLVLGHLPKGYCGKYEHFPKTSSILPPLAWQARN